MLALVIALGPAMFLLIKNLLPFTGMSEGVAGRSQTNKRQEAKLRTKLVKGKSLVYK